MLLSTAFFPPLSWFAAAAEDWGRIVASNPSSVCDVYLEAHENYCKQSYRNRCIIASANGPEAISVPVVHEGDIFHTPIINIKVDYEDPWVKKAKRAIESAYSTSAYFEYYKDDIFAILDSGIPTLWDLNLAIINFFIKKIRLGIRIVPTTTFVIPDQIGNLPSGSTFDPVRFAHPSHCKQWAPPVHIATGGMPLEGSFQQGRYGKDYRNVIHPKKENTILEDMNLEKPYFQVFAGKYGFQSDLSVMDLLFNEGPQSLLYLVPSLV